MPYDQDSPCCVMFDTFKTFASISNHDVADMILTDRPLAGGRSPRERIGDKSYLSRIIVHSEPGDLPEAMFADFEKSAYDLLSAMRSPSAPEPACAAITAEFSGEGARSMALALRAYNQDDALYLNTITRLLALEGFSDVDRAYLLVVHFLVTGCTQDSRRSADCVLNLSDRRFHAQLLTQATQSFDRVSADEREDTHLALFRVVGNRMHGAPHVLSSDPEGTEIGYLSTAPGSITDVEETVSRRHLLIFRGDDGYWYAHGLRSRNGSVLISGEDRSETVIEPPRDEAAGFVPFDVRIMPGDKLQLARDTVFLVVQMDTER